MATRFSSLFSAAGLPLGNRPFSTAMGAQIDFGSIVIPSTVALNDFDAVLPVPSGKTLAELCGDYPDLENGGPTANFDVVLASPNSSGTLTYTTAYDTSADSLAFTSLVRGRVTWPNLIIPASAYGWCYLGLRCIAAPTTGVEGTFNLRAIYR
jgi:hypothetical protein